MDNGIGTGPAVRLKEIREELSALAETKYAAFASGLLRKPGEETVSGSAARLLGVRLPILRKMAARLAKEDWIGNLKALESAGEEAAFEEIMLRGFLIGEVRIAPEKPCPEKKPLPAGTACAARQIALEEAFALIRGFLPCIDNWSLCDSFCAGLKFAGKHQEAVWAFLQPFFFSAEEYEVRFGVVMALDYFIEEEYLDRVLQRLQEVRHGACYVRMAVAWAVSVCYVRFPAQTEKWMEACALDEDTFRRAVQKIRESRRVSPEEKERLKGMLWTEDRRGGRRG